MKRQALTDESGQWFDIEKATEYKEATEWNGNNNISKATRNQTEHEILYRTASGKWVLNSWSQWQGTTESWEVVSRKFAAKWLVINEHEVDLLEDEIDMLEI